MESFGRIRFQFKMCTKNDDLAYKGTIMEMNDKTQPDFRNLLNKKTIVSFIVSFSILYILIKNVDFNSVIAVSKNLNLPIYALAIAVHYSSFYVRGLRWKKLLNALNIQAGTSVLTEMVFLSWFANSIVPAKIGDVYRSYLLKKYNRAPISTSIGTIVVERVFDNGLAYIIKCQWSDSF